MRGLAETPERKEELIGALQNIPLVTVRIQSLAEAQAAMTPARTLCEPQSGAERKHVGDAPVITVRASKLPIQDELKRYFTQISSDPTSPAAEARRVRRTFIKRS